MGWLIGFGVFIAILIYGVGFFYGARTWRRFYLYEQQRRNKKEIEVLQLKRSVMALEDVLEKQKIAA